MSRLVILDINGILCRKVEKGAPKKRGATYLAMSSYDVQLRPGGKEFLKFCFDNFDVGIFSSTTYNNANEIMSHLLTPQQNKQLKFKWFRDRTQLDPDWEKNISAHQSWQLSDFYDVKLQFYSTVKILSTVIGCPVFNDQRIYNLSNTLIVDDDMIKMRFNPKDNVVIVPSFTEISDDILFTLGDELIRRFEYLKDK